MLSEISGMIIIAGGFLYFITASLYIAEKNKTAAHYTIMAYFFSVAVWQTFHGFSISGIIFHHPHMDLIHLPFYYFSAPLLYFFFRILIRDNLQFRSATLLHFIPGIAAFICLIPFYMWTAEKKLQFLLSQRDMEIKSSLYPAYPSLIMLAVMMMTIYAAVFIFSCRQLFSVQKLALKRVTKLSIVIIAINYFMIIFYVMTFILFRYFSLDVQYFRIVIKTISIAMSIQIYLFLIMKTRYPDYILQINKESERIRYAISRINGLDVDGVVERLFTLMDVKKVFCDEDITLAGLAEELSITPYQLSQILNERLNKNFKSFINEYRIREAEKYLVDEPERSIISISYAVGFNTPATFYKSFAKIHDVSPLKFREKFIKEKR